jgi:hypothetical protein
MMSDDRHDNRAARLKLWCLVLGCVAVAGCGHEDAPSDAKQIARVLQRTATSVGKAQCERDFSQRFVREVYGSLQQCRAVNAPDPDDAVASRVSVAATHVDAGKATARLSVTRGGGPNVSGRVALVKVAGNWKLDHFGVDFLRSLFERLPADAPSRESRGIARCMRRASATVASRSLRRAGNALVGERFGLPDVFIRCLL